MIDDSHISSVNMFTGSMDTDSDLIAISNGDYKWAKNIRNGYGGELGGTTNIKGTCRLFDRFLPVGENINIGVVEDKRCDSVILYYWNSRGNHSIYRYYPNDKRSNSKGLLCKVIGGAFLNFKRHWTIAKTQSTMVDAKHLIWTDAHSDKNNIEGNPPMHMDLEYANRKFKKLTYELLLGPNAFEDGAPMSVVVYDIYGNEIFRPSGVHIAQGIEGDVDLILADLQSQFSRYGLIFEKCGECSISICHEDAERVISFVGGGLSETMLISTNHYDPSSGQDHFMLAKRSVCCGPMVRYQKNSSLPSNTLYGRLFQFRVRILYVDGTRSSWGPSSLVKVPYKTTSNALNRNRIDRSYNEILVDYSTSMFRNRAWRSLIKGVEIAFREGSDGIWKVYEYIENNKIGILRQSTVFNTNKIKSIVASDANSVGDQQSIKQYDFVPKITGALESVVDENGSSILLLGANLEGYDCVDCVDVNIGLFTRCVSNKYDSLAPWQLTRTSLNITRIYKGKSDGLVLKDGGRYGFGIVYMDNRNRRCGVSSIGEVYMEKSRSIVANYDGDLTPNIYGEYYYRVPGIEISHDPPEWASKYMIVRTRNRRQRYFKKLWIEDVEYTSTNSIDIEYNNAVVAGQFLTSTAVSGLPNLIKVNSELGEDDPFLVESTENRWKFEKAGRYKVCIELEVSNSALLGDGTGVSAVGAGFPIEGYVHYGNPSGSGLGMIVGSVLSKLEFSNDTNSAQKSVWKGEIEFSVNPGDIFLLNLGKIFGDLDVPQFRGISLVGDVHLKRVYDKDSGNLVCLKIPDYEYNLDGDLKLFSKDNEGYKYFAEKGDFARILAYKMPEETNLKNGKYRSILPDLDLSVEGCKINDDGSVNVYVANATGLIDVSELPGNVLVEFYRGPTIDEEIYYDTANCFDIVDINGKKYHKGNVQNQSPSTSARVEFLGGDTLFYVDDINKHNEEFDDLDYMLERYNYVGNDDVEANDLGTGNILDPDGGERFYHNQIRVSDVYTPQSSINGLNSFRPLSFKQIDRSYGIIKALEKVSQVLLAICEFKTQPIYVSKDRVLDLNAREFLGRTNEVLNIANETKLDLGTHNPESIVNEDGNVFCWDVYKGVVWKYSQNGQMSISDRNNTKLFFEYGEARFCMPRDIDRAIGGYERKHGSYLLSFRNISEYEIENEKQEEITLVYDHIKKGWECEQEIYPNEVVSLGNRTFSFKNASVWIHDSDDVPYNNFHGVQRESEIFMVFNDNPRSVKIPWNLKLQSNMLWHVPLVEIESSSSYPLGMNSLIKDNRFIKEEGHWFAEFMRDSLDPSNRFNGIDDMEYRVALALLQGRYLKGDAICVLLRTQDGSKYNIIRSVDIDYSFSFFTKG